MKRAPAWTIWSALTGVLWVLWFVVVFGAIRSQKSRLESERSDLDLRRAKSEKIIAGAPEVMARLNNTRSELNQAVASFVTVDEIAKLMDDIRMSANGGHIVQVSVKPDLQSTLDLPMTIPDLTQQSILLDTVQLAVHAKGAFRDIGHWLDEIEQRADFQQWVTCRWTGGEEPGRISFSGSADFWVIVGTADSLPSMGLNHE